MLTRSEIDPELHTIRTLARAADGKARQELESARFNLFAAFEARDAALASRWSQALRVALLVLDDPALRAAGLSALDAIDAAIGGAE